MTTEDAGELNPPSDARAEIEELEQDVQLLHELRDGLESGSGAEVMAEAVAGVLADRQADLDRARRQQT